MEIKSKKAYKVWRKIMDIALPLFWLWVLVIAPNIHKPNAFEEISKSLINIVISILIAGLPLYFLLKYLLKNITNKNHETNKFSLTETVPKEIAYGIIFFIVATILVILFLVPLANTLAKNLNEIIF